MTAGHCTNSASSWSATSGGASIGTREGTSFPTNDYGIVRYTNGSQPAGNVNLYNGSFQEIASSADPIVGQAIRKSGSTTKVTSGTVTAVNVTVNYGDGPAYNMVSTTACSAGAATAAARTSPVPRPWASTRAAPAAPAPTARPSISRRRKRSARTA